MGKWERTWILQFGGNKAAAALVAEYWGKKKFTKLAEANEIKNAAEVLFPDVQVKRISLERATATALD